jgi:transposase
LDKKVKPLCPNFTKLRTQKRSYSLEIKTKAVELSNQRGSLSDVTQELNISSDNLKRWKKEYKEGKFSGIIKIKTPEKQELIRLQKELADVKPERDILKKAVGIFSKSER